MLYLPNYAGALRCIGQALETRNIAVFELVVDANQFVVRCEATSSTTCRLDQDLRALLRWVQQGDGY